MLINDRDRSNLRIAAIWRLQRSLQRVMDSVKSRLNRSNACIHSI